MSKRDDPQLRVRISENLKSDLEANARLNKRTLTAEIVDRLETTLEQDYFFANNPLGYRLFPGEYKRLLDDFAELRFKTYQVPSFDSFEEHQQELREAIDTLKKSFEGELK